MQPMVNTYNNDQFFKFLYQETTQEEHKKFETELLINNELYEEVTESQSILKNMNMIDMRPSKRTSDNIMAYAIASINIKN